MIRRRIGRLWWPIRFALFLACMAPVSVVCSAIRDGRQVFPARVHWETLLIVWAFATSVYVLGLVGGRVYQRYQLWDGRRVARAEAKDAAWRKFMRLD